MNARQLTTGICGAGAALVLAAGTVLAAPEEPGGDPPRQYARVGVLPLHDSGNIREGGAILTEMLLARLGARFENVEFIRLDSENAEPAEWPVLPAEAVELGAELDLDAVLDGVFGGVEIVGGTWPNLGSDVPQARGELHWRLVECATGFPVTDGEVHPRKPMVYSQRIRSEEELIRRVMQDLVSGVGTALEEAGVLAGTEPSELKPPLLGDTSTDEQET